MPNLPCANGLHPTTPEQETGRARADALFTGFSRDRAAALELAQGALAALQAVSFDRLAAARDGPAATLSSRPGAPAMAWFQDCSFYEAAARAPGGTAQHEVAADDPAALVFSNGQLPRVWDAAAAAVVLPLLTQPAGTAAAAGGGAAAALFPGGLFPTEDDSWFRSAALVRCSVRSFAVGKKGHPRGAPMGAHCSADGVRVAHAP
jgi:hypothetical protein